MRSAERLHILKRTSVDFRMESDDEEAVTPRRAS